MDEAASILYEEGIITFEESLKVAAFDVSEYIYPIIALVCIVMLLIIAYTVLVCVAFKKIEDFNDSLLKTCAMGSYEVPAKLSNKFVFVMGIIVAAPTLISFAFMPAASLSSLALAGYLILSSLLMKNINEKQMHNNASIQAQEEILAKVADQTNKEMYSAQNDTSDKDADTEAPVDDAHPM